MNHSKRTQSLHGHIEPLENRTLFSGGLDPTFGTGGFVLGPKSPAQPIYGTPNAVLQGDGKLVVARQQQVGNQSHIQVSRFLTDGQLDTSFGFQGVALVGSGQYNGVPIAVTSSGNIAFVDAKVVCELTTEGQPNPGFAKAGQLTLPADFTAITIAAVGNQILVGGSIPSGNVTCGEIFRYNANGTVDNSFGFHGTLKFVAPVGHDDQINQIEITPTGRIAAVNENVEATGDFNSIYLFQAHGSPGSTASGRGLSLQGFAPDGSLLVTTLDAQGVNGSVFSYLNLLTPAGNPTTTFDSVPGPIDDAAIESDGSVLTIASGMLTHFSPTGTVLSTVSAQAAQILPLTGGSYLLVNSDGTIDKFRSANVIDSSFGTNGVASAPTAPIAPSQFTAVSVQSDRKVIAGGVAFNGSVRVLELTRYNVDGSFDFSFGSNGSVQTAIGAMNVQDVSLLIQPGGKIIAAVTIGGDINAGIAPTSLALVRYNSNGTIDTTFGKSGVIIVNGDGGIMDNVGYTAAPVVLWQDSKLLVGTSTTLYRYNSNGSPDSTFAKGLPGGDAFAVQRDGKVVVNVATYFDASTDTTTVRRYNLNGSVDTSFGTNGSVTSADNGSGISAEQIFVEPGGRIVLADILLAPISYRANIELLALTSNGAVDNTFGTAGTVMTPDIGTADRPTLLPQPNGQFLLAASIYRGFVAPGSLGGQYANVTRYSATGQQDMTFGKNGVAFAGTEIPGVFREGVPLTVESIAALDSAGRLLLAGGTGPTNANIFAIDTNNDTGTITGYMFYDTNGNGKRDPGDHALNWTCYIDVDNDGHYDNADIRIYTDAAGHFTIPNLAPGVYHIRQSQVSHWQKTTPAEYTVTVTTGATISGVNFGSRFIGG